jgi:hypothetical protein
MVEEVIEIVGGVEWAADSATPHTVKAWTRGILRQAWLARSLPVDGGPFTELFTRLTESERPVCAVSVTRSPIRRASTCSQAPLGPDMAACIVCGRILFAP